MGSRVFKQLEIWWIDLNPTRGAETQKKRPCVVLQADLVNQNTKTVLVAPILPRHRDWPFAVNVTPTKENGLDKARHINLKQIRSVDVSRFSKRQGLLENKYFENIEEAIQIVFGF